MARQITGVQRIFWFRKAGEEKVQPIFSFFIASEKHLQPISLFAAAAEIDTTNLLVLQFLKKDSASFLLS